MTEREKVVQKLEEVIADAVYPDRPRKFMMPLELAEDALAQLKEHEKATIEPKRIDLTDETKAWLDKMDAVDALGNIADICMDWDGYRTANGLGGLINEIWAYARYCADRLQKAQEPIEARLHLCESCTKEFPECEATVDDIEFGCGVGNDNIIGCLAYVNRWKAQEPRVISWQDAESMRLCWIETRCPHTISPADLIHYFDESPTITVFKIHQNAIDWPLDEYGIKWRCWDNEPTNEQMEEAKWE